MLKNVIFDYMGVIADLDYKKMLKNLNLIEKFKALRILVGLKKKQNLKDVFDAYQTGNAGHDDLMSAVSETYPNAASVLPKVLGLIPSCIKENKAVLALAKRLHDDGFKIILLSNAIPETQERIQNSEFVEYFDGFVLSNMVGMKKPSPEIYDFACDVYEMNPQDTIMVDDKPENLIGAERAKLKTMPCDKGPEALANRLGNLFYSQYHPQPNE